MNIWVEYWPKPVDNSFNNHAQMKEHLKWVEPETVTTRYFLDYKSAIEFCTDLHQEDKYHTRVKSDGYV